jgi:hypothetical protein
VVDHPLLLNYFCGNNVVVGNANQGDLYANHDIYNYGKTHIGLQLPDAANAHQDALLTVAGKVLAKSCYVNITNWADYVFDADYKLPNLYDTETYYKANHHLPEIPSECEVLEQGIDVGEMNKLLLKKIEEMTLLMVQQQKQIDAINAKIK